MALQVRIWYNEGQYKSVPRVVLGVAKVVHGRNNVLLYDARQVEEVDPEVIASTEVTCIEAEEEAR
jgi:hypothetical protein